MTSTSPTPHPVRYRLTAPWGASLDVIGREIAAGASLDRRIISKRVQETIGSLVLSRLYRDKGALMGRTAEELARLSALLEARVLECAAFGREYVEFIGAGAQIFELSGALVDMFARTDIDEVPAEELKLPYSQFYIALKAPLSVPADDFEMRDADSMTAVDGIYISRDGDGVTILASTPAMANKADLEECMEDCHRGVGGRIRMRLIPGKSLAQCVKVSLEEHIEWFVNGMRLFEKGITQQGGDFEAARSDAAANVASSGMRAMLSLVESGVLERRVEILVRLVANALCYITAYSESGKRQWANGTPEHLLTSLARAKSDKKVRAIERELAWGGYRRVTLLSIDPTEGGEGKAAHGSPDAHWRRGHWRMQAYGQQFSLRKLRWIRPVLVNASADSATVSGHVYTVE